MKNILAENLLRFGVKNLKESDKQKLTEQDPGDPAAMTPEMAQQSYSSATKELQTYSANFNRWTKNKANGGKGINLYLRVPASGANTVELVDSNSTRNDADKWILQYNLDTKKLIRKVISTTGAQNMNIDYTGGTATMSDWSIGRYRGGVKLDTTKPKQKTINDAIQNAAADLWTNYMGLKQFFAKLSQAPVGTAVAEMGNGKFILQLPQGK